MTPVKGEALVTKFVMSAAEGWSDPEGGPLKFQFGYRKKEEEDIEGNYFSYATQQDNSFTTVLPTGTVVVKIVYPSFYLHVTFQLSYLLVVANIKVVSNEVAKGSTL